jgi:TetR/AcrR family transcriptional regulator, transcriptional repressor for nem operon
VTMADRHHTSANTASAILDVAEQLVQSRGFNAFSYADVAATLGITKPALHYHFAGKSELGLALLVRYTTRFTQALETIDDRQSDAAARLAAYADLYAQVLAQDRMCLCGMLAADYHTLSEPMRQAVITFFDRNEIWLARLIDQGRKDGVFQIECDSREVAQTIIDTLEGALLIARTYGDPDRFAGAARRLLAEVSGSASRAAPRLRGKRARGDTRTGP